MLRKSFWYKSIFLNSWFNHFFAFLFQVITLFSLKENIRTILACICSVSLKKKKKKMWDFSNCSNYRSPFNDFISNYCHNPNILIDYSRHIYKPHQEEVYFFYRYCELQMITYYRIVVRCSNPNRCSLSHMSLDR